MTGLKFYGIQSYDVIISILLYLNKSILVGTHKQVYFSYIFLVLTVCFIYRAHQKPIKTLKNKYKKVKLNKAIKCQQKNVKQKENYGQKENVAYANVSKFEFIMAVS